MCCALSHSVILLTEHADARPDTGLYRSARHAKGGLVRNPLPRYWGPEWDGLPPPPRPTAIEGADIEEHSRDALRRRLANVHTASRATRAMGAPGEAWKQCVTQMHVVVP